MNVLDGVITADVVKSSCTSSTAGSKGSTTLVAAKVNGVAIAANPPPNTTIQLNDLGTLFLNEQIGSPAYTNGVTNITVNAIRLKLNSPVKGTGNIIVSSSRCGIDATTSVSGPLSGSAFGEMVRITTPIGTKVNSGPLPTVILPSTGGGPFTNSVASVKQPGLLSTGVLKVSTQGTTTPSPKSQSSAEVATVSILDGVVTADVVKSSCTSSTAGSTGSTTLVGAKVNGVAIAANPPPNTTIQLNGIGTLILNEQGGSMAFTNGVTTITVNAIHLRLNSPTKGTGDIVVSQAHCDVKLQ